MSKTRDFTIGLVALAGFIGLVSGEAASAVTFTTNTAISASNTDYDNQDIVVSGCTVTIDGAHTFASISLANAGTVTHSAGVAGCNITVTGDVTVPAGTAISVDGKGHGPAAGPGAGATNWTYCGGGGGYGGSGGEGCCPTAGGPAYGSLLQPVDLGSGGGHGYSCSGGAGGGAIRLNVAGAMMINGTVSANGGIGTGIQFGGGSGGSIWITAGSVGGSGSVTANGAAGGSNAGGGGGGGRIAVYYGGQPFSGLMSAAGGASTYGLGSAGTIYAKGDAQSFGELVVDNRTVGVGGWSLATGITQLDRLTVTNSAKLKISATSLAVPELLVTNGGNLDLSSAASLTVSQLTATNGGIVQIPVQVSPMSLTMGTNAQLTHASGEIVSLNVTGDLTIPSSASVAASVNLTVTGNLTINSGGSINAGGKGYAGATGPGAGSTNWTYCGGGGGYGGSGGQGCCPTAGGPAYGSLLQPVDLGSGGGHGYNSSGGAGGGAIRLNVAGALTIDGTVSANGGVGTSIQFGGGSGGSIWITAGSVGGSGSVTANGAAGGSNAGGGGGGGRIAIYACSMLLPAANITVTGGTGWQNSQLGTIYQQCLCGPPMGATANPPTICAGSSSQLSAVPCDGADTVEWFTDSCGITPVPGGASPTVSPVVTTTYYARSKNSASGCLSLACAAVTVNVGSHVAADFDGNCAVDQGDLDVFNACASGPSIPHPNTPDCATADFDHDEDVDQDDFGLFQRCYSGTGKPTDSSCGL